MARSWPFTIFGGKQLIQHTLAILACQRERPPDLSPCELRDDGGVLGVGDAAVGHHEAMPPSRYSQARYRRHVMSNLSYCWIVM